ncbi:MAG: universal stress protein [Candidatus Hodarchaeota archaeon]
MNEARKKILLAVDGSDGALEAVKYVSKIRPFQKMEVLLFNVFTKIHDCYWDLEWQPQFDRALNQLKDWEVQREKTLEEYMEKSKEILFGAGFPQNAVTVKIHERKTGMARDIISEAQRGYSAVVVGRKGMGNLKDLVLGSVATKLLEKLTFVSLMVVGKTPQPGKVLLALDGSGGAMRAVDYVGAMVGGSDFEVQLVHVIRGDTKEYFEEAIEKIGVAIAKAKSRLMESGFRSNQITNKIISRVPSRAGAIVQEAKQGGYGTIVVGRRGLSKVPDFFIGRVSNKVIQLAKNHAVWVVS